MFVFLRCFLCIITTSGTLPELYGIVSVNNVDHAEIRCGGQQDEHRSSTPETVWFSLRLKPTVSQAQWLYL